MNVPELLCHAHSYMQPWNKKVLEFLQVGGGLNAVVIVIDFIDTLFIIFFFPRFLLCVNKEMPYYYYFRFYLGTKL
jgi:hypothetical protein